MRSYLNRHICIHGHFYQPPRENPWLEEVEHQASAAPFHDWNQRVTEECYAPNTAARILGRKGQIVDIVNNYTRISFNFGPTLLSWMQRKKPEVYQQIIASDRQSRDYFSGHGSAIAQCYNHMIMPLASPRDKKTQIVWGIKDFEFRFGRVPEGMWLPETAVDLETLDLLAEQGVRFTLLAPRQAHRVRRVGDKDWRDVSGEAVDPQRAYWCHLPSGRKIAIFFYDGPISKDIAFGDTLGDGRRFSDRLMSVFPSDDHARLVHIATDGESYGHHHRFGEMALAFCLEDIEKNHLAQLTVYGEFLERFPPEYDVEIFENSSWSCVHGVERWRSNCGCNSGGHPQWHQQWRRPLRDALDWLKGEVDLVYEEHGGMFLQDVWVARDDYVDVILNRNAGTRERFFKKNMRRDLNPAERVIVLHLLEMQRNAMLMYTSCGWFFDEVSGIETVQILQYAAKAAQLAREVNGKDLLPRFLELLNAVPSNVAKYQNAAGVFSKFVLPSMVDMKRVVAHYAMTSLFETYSTVVNIYCFLIKTLSYEVFDKEEQRFAMGRVRVHSDLTCEEKEFSFVVFYFGGHDIYAGISERLAEKDFITIKKQLSRSFLGVRGRSALRIMRKNFEHGPFSLRHLFRDEQAKILYQMLDSSLFEVERSLRDIHDHHYPIMQVIRQLNMPLPKVLSNTILVMVNTDFLNVLGRDPIDFKRLSDLVTEVLEWDLDIDQVTLEFFVSRRVKNLMDQFVLRARDQRILRTITAMLKTLEPLHLSLDVGKAQNIFFSIGQKYYWDMKKKADSGHARSKAWVMLFEGLGQQLNVVIPAAKDNGRNG